MINMNDIEKAKKLLIQGGYTCVICRDGEIYTSFERGVKPLLLPLEEGRSFEGFSAADRVVGKAAACLYVLLKVGSVHAQIVSRKALDIFEKYGIELSYDELVPAIENRTKTGLCPMETAVWDIEEARDAPRAIRKTLEKLQEN